MSVHAQNRRLEDLRSAFVYACHRQDRAVRGRSVSERTLRGIGRPLRRQVRTLSAPMAEYLPMPAADTNEPTDFASEMWLLVHEGAFLMEVPGGSRTLMPDGWVVAGPWSPEECSTAFLTWFDHGWINLAVAPEQLHRWAGGASHPDLSADRLDTSWFLLEANAARRVLTAPETWIESRPEGFVSLSPSQVAPSHGFRNLWIEAIRTTS